MQWHKEIVSYKKTTGKPHNVITFPPKAAKNEVNHLTLITAIIPARAARASIYPKKWGGRTPNLEGPEVCYPNFFLNFDTLKGIPSVMEALIRLYYDVHDLKLMFNHVRNPLKTNMSWSVNRRYSRRSRRFVY